MECIWHHSNNALVEIFWTKIMKKIINGFLLVPTSLGHFGRISLFFSFSPSSHCNKNLFLSIFPPLPLHILTETTMIREEMWFQSLGKRRPCRGNTIKRMKEKKRREQNFLGENIFWEGYLKEFQINFIGGLFREKFFRKLFLEKHSLE